MAVKEIIKVDGEYSAPDFICYNTDIKPIEGVEDGSNLIEINASTNAKTYFLFFDGEWR